MLAAVLDQSNPSGIKITQVNLPNLGPNEVRVKVKAAALNHRDEWCRQGRYPNISDGVILGSDASGTVEEIGPDVSPSWLGQEVIINAGSNWGNDPKAQSKDFQILGMPKHGTLAEYVQVDVSRLASKPAHLSFEEAAALPLGGLTAFRAAFYHGKIKKGDKVLVTGFGGGVAQFATQYALAVGAQVYVNSSSNTKIQRAIDLGAIDGFNYKEESWETKAEQQSGGFDTIIDSAMGDTLPALIKLLVPGGRLIVYGATLGNPPMLDARRIFWNQLTIQGTTMGSDQDFREMVAFVAQHELVPVIDSVRPLDKVLEAFEAMAKGDQTGKLVVSLG
ncbi:zinc-binding dehydrogenase [Echinicola sediminis]